MRGRDKYVVDELQRELDRIERTTKMTGSYTRIDPEIYECEQSGTRFRFVAYHMESKIWYGQIYQDPVLASCVRADLIREDEIVFDIGCNGGYYTVWFALNAPTGHVHAFDPYPWNTASTRAQAALNGCTNITAHNVGLGETDRDIEVNATSAKTFNPDVAHGGQMSIRVRKPDHFASHQPSFLKIDIEGAEQELARSSILSWPSVRRGYVEMHPEYIVAAGEKPPLFLESAINNGYKVHLVDPSSPVIEPPISDVIATAYFFIRSAPPRSQG